MISSYIQFAVFLCCHSFGDYSRENCPPYAINYMDWKMTFPSTVGEAVKVHQLDYKPPGFYYKTISVNRGEVFLNYKYKRGDFHNEYQPREILFPREVDSYIFRFPEKDKLQDSLKIAIEKVYKKKFKLTMATNSSIAAMPMNYDLFFMEVDSCMTIGLASSPTVKKKDRHIVVRFLYNHSPEDRISEMMNYLL